MICVDGYLRITVYTHVFIGPRQEETMRISWWRLTLRDRRASRFAIPEASILPLPAEPTATATTSQATWSHSYFCLCLLIVNCLLLAGGWSACSAESKGDGPYLESANSENNIREIWKATGKQRERERERISSVRETKRILAASTSPTKCSEFQKSTPRASLIPVYLSVLALPPSLIPRSYIHQHCDHGAFMS